MTSEIEHLRESPQKYGVSESSAASKEISEKLHITSRGREGKVLRKKLAIALGLKPNSSASTTSQSEGEDVQNVVDVFRKQVRKTVDSRSRSFPRTTQERELQNLDKSSLILRKTVRKTTDINELFEEDFEDFDDDIDEQETVSQKRSKEQYSMTGEKSQTFGHHERSHDSSREKHKRERKTTEAVNVNEFINKDINEEERASRRTKKIQDSFRMREMTDHKSGKTLFKKIENEGSSEIISKTESWDLETRNAKEKVPNVESTSEKLESIVNTNAMVSEDIFSSYGEQSEKAPNDKIEEVSPRESVKHLREKIRKNTRARQLRRSSRGDRDLEKSRDNQNPGKTASISEIQSASELQESSSVASGNKDEYFNYQLSSTIPIPISRRKSSDTQARTSIPGYKYLETEKLDINEMHKENMLDSKTKLVQKSKIPRRKSQNTKDEMRSHGVRLNFDEIKEPMVDAQSGKSIQSFDKKLPKREDVESESVSQQIPLQKRNSNLGQLLRKVSKKTDSIKPSATTGETEFLNTNITSTNNFIITGSREEASRSVRQFDFDAFEAELSELKASVFKTYEEFKDIKSMALGVEEELNDLKSSYGVSYICMYGN